jgi:hypothetical protein
MAELAKQEAELDCTNKARGVWLVKVRFVFVRRVAAVHSTENAFYEAHLCLVNHEIFLFVFSIQVPKYVAEAWDKVAGDAEAAKLRIEK